MSLLDERGTGAISWQRNLAVLWCGVFLHAPVIRW